MAVYKVYGKQHCKGVSKKTGKDYDFYNLHLLVRDRNVDGLACCVKMVDPSVIPYDNIIVNQMYDFSTDFNGNIDGITPAKT